MRCPLSPIPARRQLPPGWVRSKDDPPEMYEPTPQERQEAEWEPVRRAMWNQHKATRLFLCALCPMCGGSSMSTCECAYERFRPSVTDMTLYKLKKDREYKAELERKAEAFKAQAEAFTTLFKNQIREEQRRQEQAQRTASVCTDRVRTRSQTKALALTPEKTTTKDPLDLN